jgi:hypothetical protein
LRVQRDWWEMERVEREADEHHEEGSEMRSGRRSDCCFLLVVL